MKIGHRYTGIIFTSMLFAACTGGPANLADAPTGAAGEDAVIETGVLELEETPQSIAGRYTAGAHNLRFRSVEVAAEEFDIELELNGMVLAAVIDNAAQVAEIDGFAAGGGDTQMVADDRLLLASFVRALELETDTADFAAAAVLYRAVSRWSQNPDTVPLQRQVAGGEDRAFVSICGFNGQFLEATHDGNVCGFFDPNCTSIAEVGRRTSATFSFINGVWTTDVPDHLPRVFQLGECYGNCGAGCPSGNQTLTLDCHDHDQCVRNGHFIASFFCNDEFVSASDDEFFAPRCSGT